MGKSKDIVQNKCISFDTQPRSLKSPVIDGRSPTGRLSAIEAYSLLDDSTVDNEPESRRGTAQLSSAASEEFNRRLVKAQSSFSPTTNASFMTERPELQSIGAKKIVVASVGSLGIENGRFCFDISDLLTHDWQHWLQEPQYVVQLRHARRIWSGKIVVEEMVGEGSGGRATGHTPGQWQVGDMILQGLEDDTIDDLWEAIALGTDLDALDDSIVWIDPDMCDSVSIALDELREGRLECPEGLCILFSKSRAQYYLLYRTPDMTEEARRISSEFNDFHRKLEEYNRIG